MTISPDSTELNTLLERLQPFVEPHANAQHWYGFDIEQRPGQPDRIWPRAISYGSSVVTQRFGIVGSDRFCVWHASGGHHYRGYGTCWNRGYHESELWIVEVSAQSPHADSGRYHIAYSYRAGRSYRRVLPDVVRLCSLLNAQTEKGHGEETP